MIGPQLVIEEALIPSKLYIGLVSQLVIGLGCELTFLVGCGVLGVVLF